MTFEARHAPLDFFGSAAACSHVAYDASSKFDKGAGEPGDPIAVDQIKTAQASPAHVLAHCRHDDVWNSIYPSNGVQWRSHVSVVRQGRQC